MKMSFWLGVFLLFALTAWGSPIRSQSYAVVQGPSSCRFLLKDERHLGLRDLANELVERARSRSLFHLKVDFEGTPTREEALNQIGASLAKAYRETQIFPLGAERIRGEAYIILDGIMPSINRTDLMNYIQRIQDWQLEDSSGRLVLRIAPRGGNSRHALALVALEDDRAQAMILEISSPD